MENLFSIMFKLIEIIQFIFYYIFNIFNFNVFNFNIFNFNIFNLVKLLLFYIIYRIVVFYLYKLVILFKNKKNSYDETLLKIYKLLKKKNFISRNLINTILKKIKNENVTIVNIKDDKNIKLFKFINKQIQIKYKLNDKSSTNIIYYLYNLIKKINN